MVKLIEEDADSFGQRAEMYYKKRPQLINMVEDFYRSHRSLAERFDMLKSEPRARLARQLSSPLVTKCQLNKLTVPTEKSEILHSPLSTNFHSNKLMEKSYDSYSDAYSECGESEVDDPEHDEEKEDSAESEVDDLEQVDTLVDESEVKKLRDEIERLKEENMVQTEQLMQKDEEKREVIRQLSASFEILKENANLGKRRTAGAKESLKKWGPFEFNKGKRLFSVNMFGVPSKRGAYNMAEF